MNRVWLALMIAVMAAQGAAVRTVYLLPMSGGLDSYLAQWLTREQVVRVTADPKHADAVMTDRLGEDFERKLDQILAASPKGDDSGANKAAPHPYSAGRNRGTVFLVDAKTRQVLWSDYEAPPAYRTPAKLNSEAQRIAKRLAAGLSK